MKLKVPSGELLVLLLAIPALSSPLLLVPLPDDWVVPQPLIVTLLIFWSFPRVWASLATVAALTWISRADATPGRKALVLSVALMAWPAAWHTAKGLSGFVRF